MSQPADKIRNGIWHTPGPWDYDMDYIVAPDPNGRHPDIYIAEIAHCDVEGRIASNEQQDANRRLIAVAPELLECLQTILAVFNAAASNNPGTSAIITLFGNHDDSINNALRWRQDTRAAIAKTICESSIGRPQ